MSPSGPEVPGTCIGAADLVGMQMAKVPEKASARLYIIEHLGNAWRALADAVEIPEHERATFEQGDEGRAILIWVEERNRWDSLAGAITQIGREDLVPYAEALVPPSPTQIEGVPLFTISADPEGVTVHSRGKAHRFPRNISMPKRRVRRDGTCAIGAEVWKRLHSSIDLLLVPYPDLCWAFRMCAATKRLQDIEGPLSSARLATDEFVRRLRGELPRGTGRLKVLKPFLGLDVALNAVSWGAQSSPEHPDFRNAKALAETIHVMSLDGLRKADAAIQLQLVEIRGRAG